MQPTVDRIYGNQIVTNLPTESQANDMEDGLFMNEGLSVINKFANQHACMVPPSMLQGKKMDVTRPESGDEALHTMISDFDEAHLQSLVSSLGTRQRFPENSTSGYVKDPQSRGNFPVFFKKKRSIINSALQRHCKTYCGFCAMIPPENDPS